MSITYQELSRKASKRGGWDITAEFLDGETGETRQKTMYFPRENPSPASVIARFDYCSERIAYKVNPLNSLDIEGIDSRELIEKLVTYIRANPTVSFSALTTVADTQFPDLPWKPEKILLRLQDYLQERLKKSFTFNQFKTYVIDHKISGVDE